MANKTFCDKPDDREPVAPGERVNSPARRQAPPLHMARCLEGAPGLFLTLRMEADGRICMPFAAGGLAARYGLMPEAEADDMAALLALFHPDDAAALLAALRRSADGMTPCRAELRIRDAAMERVVLEFKALPHCDDASPGAVEWNGFMHHVTACKLAAAETQTLLGTHSPVKTEITGCVRMEEALAARRDETKLHELEVELRRRAALEEQISSLAEAAPGFIYSVRLETDGRMRFPFASDGVVELFGLRPEEFRDDLEVLRARYHPDDLVRVRECMAESAQGLTPYRIEIRIRHPEKGERWVEIRGTPRPQADGAIEWHGLLFDVTERKQAEAELKAQYDEIVRLNERLEENARDLEEHAVELEASQEQLRITEAWYRSVLHSAPDGMLVINERGAITMVNAQLERMFGYAESELIGRPIELLVPPDARGAHVSSRNAFIGKRKNSNRPSDRTLRGCRKDGSQFAADVTLSRLPGTDGAGTICAAIRDISERIEAERALDEARTRLLDVLQTIPDMVWLKDVDGVYRACNHAFERLNGNHATDIVGKTDYDLFDAELADFFRAKDRAAIEAGHILINEEWVTYPNTGERALLETRKVPVYGSDRKVTGVLGVARDITERKRMEAALAEREREFRTLVENSPDTVARHGRDFRHLYVNPAFATQAKGGAAALIGKTPAESTGGLNAAIYQQKLAEVFASGKESEFELEWKDKDGKRLCSLIRLTPELGAGGEVESILAVGRDITELNAVRQKIHQMAFYDSLTALPNRALFNDRLRQMITDASCHGQSAGVMMIDMDRFKAVNDTMGHAVGDDLLREAAARLNTCVHAYDTVARLGGDEFAVLLPEIRNSDEVGRIAGEILDKFDERFLLDGKEVFISCSIGIALYPGDSTEADDLMKYADSAMYFAKRSGRNNFRFYSKDLTASAKERLTLEAELRHAIERHELELHYQPKVSLQDGMVVGSEALLRWRHPRRGMVPPLQFIQIAEDTGLIVDIGQWVLREACRTASEWNAAGGLVHKIAINLSARQFESQNLAATVAAILAETACRPEWIELEITESLLLDEDGKTLETLSAFRAMGISIAIDDFGTGYSALSYLARFPIDTLKIDRSFIHTVTTDTYRAELVKAILSIARCLRQQVVAEGVETVQQAVFLEAHGCPVAQGYLYSKPLPKGEIASLPRCFGNARAAEQAPGPA